MHALHDARARTNARVPRFQREELPEFTLAVPIFAESITSLRFSQFSSNKLPIKDHVNSNINKWF